MLKTWLMARSRNKCIFAILLAVLVFFILPFLWLIKDEVRMMLVENPETCALCDGQPHDVPCLLDINRGQVVELVGSQVPGRFQYVGAPSVLGGWDPDAQTGWVSIPEEAPALTVPLFCRSCRWKIVGNPPAVFYLADLTDPAAPVLYPIEAGTLDLLGWTIATEQTDDGFDLTISPH